MDFSSILMILIVTELLPSVRSMYHSQENCVKGLSCYLQQLTWNSFMMFFQSERDPCLPGIEKGFFILRLLEDVPVKFQMWTIVEGRFATFYKVTGLEAFYRYEKVTFLINECNGDEMELLETFHNNLDSYPFLTFTVLKHNVPVSVTFHPSPAVVVLDPLENCTSYFIRSLTFSGDQLRFRYNLVRPGSDISEEFRRFTKTLFHPVPETNFRNLTVKLLCYTLKGTTNFCLQGYSSIVLNIIKTFKTKKVEMHQTDDVEVLYLDEHDFYLGPAKMNRIHNDIGEILKLYQYSPLKMLSQVPQPLFDAVVRSPFSINVWLTVMCTVTCLTVLFSHQSAAFKDSPMLCYVTVATSLICSIFQQGLHRIITDQTRFRYLVCMWLLGVLVLSTAFQSTWISYTESPIMSMPITTLSVLKRNLREEKVRLCVPIYKRGKEESSIMNSVLMDLILSKAMNLEETHFKLGTEGSCLRRVSYGDRVMVQLEGKILDYDCYPECNFFVSEDSLMLQYLVCLGRRNSPFITAVNSKLTWVFDSGASTAMYERRRREVLEMQRLYHFRSEFKALSVKAVWNYFTTMSVIYAAAGFMFLFEILSRRSSSFVPSQSNNNPILHD